MALIGFIERLLEHPTIYALVQARFVDEKFAVMERHFRSQKIKRVLDLGCGPGINAARFADADYVGVDINERYLAAARAKHRGRFVQADIETADLLSLGTFDTILVNSLLHHLPDEGVRRILRQLPALLEADGTVHVLELLQPKPRSLVGIMALVDRGRYPRPLAAWRELFEEHFEPLTIQPHVLKGGLWAQVYLRGRAKQRASTSVQASAC